MKLHRYRVPQIKEGRRASGWTAGVKGSQMGGFGLFSMSREPRVCLTRLDKGPTTEPHPQPSYQTLYFERVSLSCPS